MVWLFCFLLLPILIHLFAFRWSKTYHFSSLKFIRQVKASSKRKTAVKNYLILLNRVFIFLALIFSYWSFFTSPSDRTIFPEGRYIYFDASPSMFIESNGQTPYARGTAYLSEIGKMHPSNLPDEKGKVKSALINDHFSMYFSDFQGVSLSLLEAIKKDTISDKTLVHLGDEGRTQNLFIDSLQIMDASSDLEKRRVKFFPKISVGNKEESTAVYRLIHAGDQLASVTQIIGPNDGVVFYIPSNRTGEFVIEVSGDNVLYDNTFYFYLEEQTKPSVILLSDGGNAYLEEVFANTRLFDFNKMNLANVDYELLREAEVIVLHSDENLSNGLVHLIKDKTVLVFPAESERFVEIWPAISSSILRKEALRQSIDVGNENPLLANVFQKPKVDIELPSGTPLYDLVGDYETYLSYRDKSPYLIRLADSDIYFFNSSLRPESSDIMTHAVFLPLMYQLAFSAQKSDVNVYFRPGDMLNLRVENQELAPKIISKEVELIPEFNPTPTGLAIKLPYLAPGFYKLWHPDDSITVALNIEKEESLMEGISKNMLAEYFAETDHVKVVNDDASDNSSATKKGLWKYALILILVLAFSETLLHIFL